MDSIPSYEFHKIFDRVSDNVDLKGKFTVEQIERALVRVRNYCVKKYRKAESASQRTMYKTLAIHFEQLLEHGFADRAYWEALKNPDGIEALTLELGRGDALYRRLRAQKRAQRHARFLREI